MPGTRSIHLSKSQFIRGLQCPKSLWLLKNRPELRDPVDAATQARFDVGIEVGILAQQLFPNGESIKFSGGNFKEMLARTRQLITQGATTIYEASFSFDNIFVMVDILHKGKKGWEIHEVKSSTGVKEVHVHDAGIQYYVLTGKGLDVARTTIVHLDTSYVRQGELDLCSLFFIADVTEPVLAKQDFLRAELTAMRQEIKTGMPDRDIGVQCNDPYPCDFIGHCWQHIPEYSIFNLARLKQEKKFDLYSRGIVRLEDIPEDYPLSVSQRIQVECARDNSELIRRDAIRVFLTELWFPLYFLDFETFQQPVPLFDGVRPYQQIPFQYSLHTLAGPDGDLDHQEFLAPAGRDPRRELAERLVVDIPGPGCVLAYNQVFEKGVIRRLAEAYPDLREKLLAIHDNIRDLMAPFLKKDFYLPQMRGSYSIKYVLPALVPELSYQGLAIADGDQAMNAYATLHLLKDEREIEEKRRALLEYCRMDTLAMVRIWERLVTEAR